MPLTEQQDYDLRLRFNAEKAHREMQLMKQLLQNEQQAAQQAGNANKAHEISLALRKVINCTSPAILIQYLDDIHRQQSKWKPSSLRTLTDRSDDAGEVLSEVGQLGHLWRDMLHTYQVPNLPNNPTYNA